MVVNSAAIANVANRGEAPRAAKEQVCALKQLSLDKATVLAAPPGQQQVFHKAFRVTPELPPRK